MVNIGVIVLLVFALLKKEIFEDFLKKLSKSTVAITTRLTNVHLIDYTEPDAIEPVPTPKILVQIPEVSANSLEMQGEELLKAFYNSSSVIKEEYDYMPPIVQRIVHSDSYECVIGFMAAKPVFFDKFPVLKDVLVDVVIRSELNPEEIDKLLSFMFNRKLYREIALIVSFMEPLIPYYLFMPYEKMQLSRVFDYLLMISKSEHTNFRIESLFNHKDGFNFVAPLVAAEKFDEETFRNVFEKFSTDSRTEISVFIHQICFGMALQTSSHEDRNEMIIKYTSALENQSISVYLSIRTCKILNL